VIGIVTVVVSDFCGSDAFRDMCESSRTLEIRLMTVRNRAYMLYIWVPVTDCQCVLEWLLSSMAPDRDFSQDWRAVNAILLSILMVTSNGERGR
jgi:hypothetical protein